jgi:hypothetical protein
MNVVRVALFMVPVQCARLCMHRNVYALPVIDFLCVFHD